MSIRKLSVDLTPEITVEYTFDENNTILQIKNDKYTPLTCMKDYYSTLIGIIQNKSFGFEYLYDRRNYSNNHSARINKLLDKLSSFCNLQLVLADEINYFPSRLRAMILSGFLEFSYSKYSYSSFDLNDFDFSKLYGLDLEYFVIYINKGNLLLHPKLIPEIVNVICSVHFTEDIVLKHIKNYPISPKYKVKVFLPVEEKMNLIKMVKSAKGRKDMQKFIFSTRDNHLIKKVIQEYKLNPDTIIDSALKINDGILISEMYKLLSKKKKDTVTDEIIKTMPKLVGTNVTLELLESLPDVHWTMYGPEPKITQYHSTEPLPKCLKPETLPEVTRFILEKVPNVIDKEWLKNYLKVKKVDKNFFENMVVFNDYFTN